MKKILLISFALFGLMVVAQPGGKMRERIKAQKVAFITEQLNLTSKEAQQFWPIYNAFEEKTENVKSKDLRQIKQKLRQNPDMSDKEADKLLQDLIVAEDKMYKAKSDLITDLKGVISSKKIIKLKRAEDEFNRKLLERLREFRDKRKSRN